jgi:hypothetical protein
MKVSIKNFEDGAYAFAVQELCPKIDDWRKWCIPAAVRIFAPTAKDYINKNRTTLMSSGYLDENNNIELDGLYDTFHEIAEKVGPINQPVPIIGSLTLSSKDIETLYKLIKGTVAGIY